QLKKMKPIQHIIFFLTAILLANSAMSQDMHFSQYYAAPLYYNPANTGLFNADYRVGGNYKNQWPWARSCSPTNYRTFSGYADLSLLKGKLFGEDKIGLGFIALNDRAGDGDLSTTRLGISMAYHKTLGYENRITLSIGAAGMFVQKRVDYDFLYFDNQWSDSFFDHSLASGENTGENNYSYFDLSGGINISYAPNDKFNFTIGAGMFHLNRPRETFYNFSNRLGVRPNIIAVSFV